MAPKQAKSKSLTKKNVSKVTKKAIKKVASKKAVKRPTKVTLKGKGKKKKDPAKPKRALSAYIYFAMANRNAIMRKHGLDSKNISAVGKAIGQSWAQLSASERKPYEAKAAADLKRSAAARAKYKAANRRPLSSYMQFVKSQRTAIVEKFRLNPSDIKKVGIKMGEVWRGMTAAQRAPFEAAAKRDKAHCKK